MAAAKISRGIGIDARSAPAPLVLSRFSGPPFKLAIPTKAPVFNGIMAPGDSGMMAPPCNGMIPPGRRTRWPARFVSPVLVFGQGVFGCFGARSTQAFARQLDAAGVVNEAIQDRIGVGGISNNLMPGSYGELRGDDRRSAPVALFEDLEKIVARASVERLEAEVVENEQIGASEGFQKARMAAVAARERQLFAELRPAMIDDGAIVAARLLADGAGEPTFPDARWTDESQIIVSVDPSAFGELLEQGAIEPARGAIVDVFDGGLLAELGGAQTRRQPLVAPERGFPVEQQGEPVVAVESFASSVSASSAKALAIP